MNNLKICLHNHINFNGFTVQPGMIFGVDPKGFTVVSNGVRHRSGFFIYTNENCLDGDFMRVHITEESHPQLYAKISKALRRRKKMDLDGVLYRTSAQLEFERWRSDPARRFFNQACVPVGKTPKSVATVDPHAVAKYNGMKERTTLTQNVSTTKYNGGLGTVTVI